jgi:hypothetical protein
MTYEEPLYTTLIHTYHQGKVFHRVNGITTRRGNNAPHHEIFLVFT